MAGITVAAYLIPQVMAYAELAGVHAVAGLWAVLAPLAVYALLGSSRQLSIGPESTTALMTAAAAAAVARGDPRLVPEAAAALALAVGLVCLIGWLARLSFLANLLSRPVLTGYLAGIALLMIVSQLDTITGVPVEGDTPLAELRSFVARVDQLHGPTTIMALTIVMVLLASARWLPRLPGPLLIIVATGALVALAGLQERGIATIGHVPRGLPVPSLPDVSSLNLVAIVPAALGLAVVAYSDNILTGRAFATRRGQRIDSRQEFLALGVANVAGGLSQGFPISSSGSRTAVADAAGARTQLHSLVTLLLVVVTLLVLAPAFSSVPTAALGGVVVYAATRLVDRAGFVRLLQFRRSEFLLAVLTTVAVAMVGVLYGIAVAVALSILDLLRRIASPHDGVLGIVQGVAGMHDVDDYSSARQIPGLLVYRYDSPLFFANADNFKIRALRAVDDAAHPVTWFVLNAEAIVEIDLTALDALEELRSELERRGVVFAMARVKHELYETLERTGFIQRVGPDRIFATLPTAVAAYRRWGRFDTTGPTGL